MTADRPVRIEYLTLSQLRRAPRNPKNHRLDVVAESMDRFGYVSPILINDKTGRIVAGHGRLDTLLQKKRMGAPAPERIEVNEQGEWLVPVIRGIGFASDAEAEAYLLADNQTTILGGFDTPVLSEILKEHAQLPRGLRGTGYTHGDVDALMKNILLSNLRRTWEPTGPKGFDHEMDGIKLGSRLEALARCERRLRALELFAGRGLLSYWYRRNFKQLVRVDRSAEGKPDFAMTATRFIERHLNVDQPFDLVDFDDEGCPSEELQAFFMKVATRAWPPFVLCLTDGGGLNIQWNGDLSAPELQKLYLYDASKDLRREARYNSERDQSERLPDLVEHHVMTLTERAGYRAERISVHRSSRKHVVYGAYKVWAK